MAKKRKKKKGNSKTAFIAIVLIGIIISHFITNTPAKGDADYSQNLCVPRFVADTEEQIIEHAGYIVSYNSKTRNANWVGYELTDEEAEGIVERGEEFIPDPLVRGPQATDDDYKKSGWDRGHLAPAGDMKWSKQAMDESFYLSNVSPQDKNLNRGTWKRLEELCRDRALLYGKITVITGPIFTGEKARTIGRNRVRVPDAFFKVLLSDYRGKYRAIGFICNNTAQKSTPRECARSVDEIEKLTNLDFFEQLPDSIENQMETNYSAGFWGI